MACYGWGKNDFNQIFYGPVEKENEKNVVKIPKKISIQSKVTQIAIGTKHCLFLDKYGYVWSSGRNVEGQRGIGSKSYKEEAITRLGGELIKEVIIYVAAGGNMSFGISLSGAVYNWGLVPLVQDQLKNNYHSSGKLLTAASSSNDTKKLSEMPEEHNKRSNNNEQRQTYLQRVIRRSESAYYYNDQSLFTTKDTNVTEGLIALKVKLHKVFEPQKVSSLDDLKCKKIVCGCAHTAALTSDGNLYTRGYNDKGQLGVCTRIHSSTFQLVKLPYKCIDIACGSDHNIVLCDNNSVLAFGAGALGQLGLGPKQKDTLKPTKISFLHLDGYHRIKDIACGQYHSVILAEEASEENKNMIKTNIYSFGLSEYDIHNINGLGRFRFAHETRYYFSPRRLQSEILNGKVITKIGCTAHSTIVKTYDDKLYTWGWRSSGVLGNHGVGTPGITQINGMKNINSFFPGEYNVFAITKQEDGHTYGLKFKPLLDDEIFSDTILTVGASRFYLHSFILAARCPNFFTECIDSDGKYEKVVVKIGTTESGKEYYMIKVTSKKEEILYCAMLNYIYSDHCVLPKHLISSLAGLASQFNLKYLFARCVGSSNTTVEEEIQSSGILGGKRVSLLDSIKNFGRNGTRKLKAFTNGGLGHEKDKIKSKSFQLKSHSQKSKNRNKKLQGSIIVDGQNEKGNINVAEIEDTTFISSSFVYDFHHMLLNRYAINKFDVYFECKNDNDSIESAYDHTTSVIGAHRAIITTVPYFRSLLCGGFKESRSNSNIIVDCSVNVFVGLLKWIYTGDERLVNENNALGLLVCSKQYMLEDLLQVVEHFVINNMDEKNAKFLIEFAKFNDFPRLLNQAGLKADNGLT
jgi:alpha-tubulin suppressor-like RCC1 family protein